MKVEVGSLERRELYKLMTGIIVPRPIGWVSSISEGGVPNLAPFSFFNGVCSNPPAVSVSISHPGRDQSKDTWSNISALGQFVVNIVDEKLAAEANETATDFPFEIDEFEAAGLTPVPGDFVRVPRVAESPVSLECELFTSVRVGEEAGGATLVVGEIKVLHLRDDLVDDQNHVDIERLAPVGRLAGANYAYVHETFAIPRKSYDPESGEARESS